MGIVKVDSFDGEKGYIDSVDRTESMYAIELDGATYLAPGDIGMLAAALSNGENSKEQIEGAGYRAFRILNISSKQNSGTAVEVKNYDVIRKLAEKYPFQPSADDEVEKKLRALESDE